VPRVPKNWLDCVVYMYPSVDAALKGVRAGGTGFIVSVPTEHSFTPDKHHVYFVTNSHVVREGASPVVRLNLPGGGFDVLPYEDRHWTHHPDGDDVAVAPAAGLDRFRSAQVSRSMFLTPEKQAHWDFGPGDETFFIGRYVDRDGKAHNVPSVRFGTISVLPAEPVYQRERGIRQESILVEARSLSGFSGSPVFIYASSYISVSEMETEPGRLEKAARVNPVIGSPCFLLGVDWGHHPWVDPVRSSADGLPHPDGDFVRTSLGMMMVVPAVKILELLDSPEGSCPRSGVKAD